MNPVRKKRLFIVLAIWSPVANWRLFFTFLLFLVLAIVSAFVTAQYHDNN